MAAGTFTGVSSRIGGRLSFLLVLGLGLLGLVAAVEWAILNDYIRRDSRLAFLVGYEGLFLVLTIVVLVLLVAFVAMSRGLAQRGAGQATPSLRTLEGIAAVVVVAFAVAAISGTFGTALLSLGLVGFGLTLALQRPILSMGGWAAIRFGRLFREGDRIEVQGIVGDVLEISLFKTRLWEIGSTQSPLPWGGAVSPLRQTGRMVVLSNATFLEHPLANATTDVKHVFDEFVVNVGYEADWRLGRQILRDVASKVIDAEAHAAAAVAYERLARWMPTRAEFPKAPEITMVLEESWIELRLRYLVDVRRRSEIRTRLADEWQTESEKHPEQLPNVYRRSQPMAIDAAGRARPS